MSKMSGKIALCCTLLCLAAVSCTKHHEEKPLLNLYVMSHCPFGIRAEESLLDVIGYFGNGIGLRVSYIVSKSGNNFTSLHGPTELEEDLRQIGVQRLYGSKFYGYLRCYDSTMNSDLCLFNNAIDRTRIDAFVRSGKAGKVLDSDFAATERLGINASPTLYIDSHRYRGPIQPERIIRAACASFTGLSSCKTLKPPVNVDITVLTGGWEGVYHPVIMKEGLDDFFYKATVGLMEAGSPQGRALAKRLGLRSVPVMVFSSTVAATPSFGMLKRRLREIDGEYVDPLSDLGYRHIIDRPFIAGRIVLFVDVTDKSAVNACISILRLLRDYKKYQYHPDIKVIASMNVGKISDEIAQSASIIHSRRKTSFDGLIAMMIRLYTAPSLSGFNKAFPVRPGEERAARIEIARNDALASGLGIGQAPFAVLVDNTELVDPLNPNQAIDIFELSPIIGKQSLTTGPAAARQCAK